MIWSSTGPIGRFCGYSVTLAIWTGSPLHLLYIYFVLFHKKMLRKVRDLALSLQCFSFPLHGGNYEDQLCFYHLFASLLYLCVLFTLFCWVKLLVNFPFHLPCASKLWLFFLGFTFLISFKDKFPHCFQGSILPKALCACVLIYPSQKKQTIKFFEGISKL